MIDPSASTIPMIVAISNLFSVHMTLVYLVLFWFYSVCLVVSG